MSLVRYTLSLRARILAGDEPPWLRRHPRRDYVVMAHLSRPPWLKSSAFKRLKQRRKQLERITGQPHTLDHIVPMNHPYVCGLTVPWNMQPIPRSVNASKSNRWAPDQLGMFEHPEQFALPICAERAA